MSLTGYQFDKMRVTPAADGLVYDHLMHNQSSVVNDFKHQFSITNLGTGSIRLGSGAAVIKGRTVVSPDDETLTPPDNATSSLTLTIDLSKENSATGSEAEGTYEAINNQVSLNFVTGTLQKENINDNGTIYMCKLATIVRAGTSITITKDSDFYTPFGFGPSDLAKLNDIAGKILTDFSETASHKWYCRRIGNIVFFNMVNTSAGSIGFQFDTLPLGYRNSYVINHSAIFHIGMPQGDNQDGYFWVGGRAGGKGSSWNTTQSRFILGPNEGDAEGPPAGVVWSGWYFTDDPMPS